jgi:streptogramin lyase
MTFYPVPTRGTVMHRIIRGPGGAMWFTEMHADRLGRIYPGR